MLNINIGDYVRTYDGYIARCERHYPTDDWWHFDSTIISDEYDYDVIDKKELNKYVKKISPNIIDLIEEGDYVNGERVFHKTNNWSDGKMRILADSGEGYISNHHIRTVVTKEQFELMEYKIER